LFGILACNQLINSGGKGEGNGEWARTRVRNGHGTGKKKISGRKRIWLRVYMDHCFARCGLGLACKIYDCMLYVRVNSLKSSEEGVDNIQLGRQ
jgi:hypothetical protein